MNRTRTSVMRNRCRNEKLGVIRIARPLLAHQGNWRFFLLLSALSGINIRYGAQFTICILHRILCDHCDFSRRGERACARNYRNNMRFNNFVIYTTRDIALRPSLDIITLNLIKYTHSACFFVRTVCMHIARCAVINDGINEGLVSLKFIYVKNVFKRYIVKIARFYY